MRMIEAISRPGKTKEKWQLIENQFFVPGYKNTPVSSRSLLLELI